MASPLRMDLRQSPDTATAAQDGRPIQADLARLFATLQTQRPQVAAHCLRVSQYCGLLVNLIPMTAHERRLAVVSALLHDVGKLTIPTEVLEKPSALSTEEWELMKQHPDLGAKLALLTGQDTVVVQAVRHHHEQICGKGYPAGLAGAEIPLLSRVVAIVDAFDAMTSDRPYRKGISIRSARMELRQVSGRQMDDTLVDLFLRLPVGLLEQVKRGS